MNRQLRQLLSTVIGIACAGATSWADEGRIPVSDPNTTLSVPGRYVVTRNLTGTGSPIITLNASDIDLDLNGMLITQSDAGQVAIQAGGGFWNHRIHGGSVRGGLFGINVSGVTKRAVIEGVDITGSGFDGIRINDTQEFVVRNNIIHDVVDPGNGCGLRITPFGGSVAKRGLIEDNAFRRMNRGIVVLDARGVVVTRNRLIDIDSTAVEIWDSLGLVISQNTIHDVGVGITLDSNSHDNVLTANTVTTSIIGIDLLGGDRNLLDGNVCNANTGWGIRLSPGSTNNVYRGNMARGNGGSSPCPIISTADFCVHTAGNTSAGNNFLPNAGM